VKFAVRYPGGAVHDIAIEGLIAVVGRDPSCDLVLNDPKSSRRHAVVESGPDGLVIRDTGSANGISVNGRKTERAALSPGDVFRIGDVEVTILGEEVGTLVMDDLGPQSMGGGPPANTGTLPPRDSFPPAAPGSPPLPTRAPPAAARADDPMGPPTGSGREGTAPAGTSWKPATRPLTVSVLAVLWGLSIPFHTVIGVALARSRPGSGMWIAGLLVLFAIVAGVMAYGLWTARGWASPGQIALAALGILYCPFTLASIAVLAYMLRPPARRYFTHTGGDTTADQAEAVFAAAVVAAAVLGGLILAGLTIVARTAYTGVG
jgi:FHA domain-containing protein